MSGLHETVFEWDCAWGGNLLWPHKPDIDILPSPVGVTEMPFTCPPPNPCNMLAVVSKLVGSKFCSLSLYCSQLFWCQQLGPVCQPGSTALSIWESGVSKNTLRWLTVFCVTSQAWCLHQRMYGVLLSSLLKNLGRAA